VEHGKRVSCNIVKFSKFKEGEKGGKEGKERTKERNYGLHLSPLRVTEQILVLHLTVDNPLKVWQCSGFNIRQGKKYYIFLQCGSAVHSVSYTTETGYSLDRESGWGVKLVAHLRSVPTL